MFIPPTVPPGPAVVHVWRIELAGADAGSSRTVLRANEVERASRFATADLQRRFVVARSALRRILSGYTGVAPDDIEFVAGPHGKPSMRGADGLEFNLSHSGELALLAVTSGLQVGIDVEQIRDVSDAEAIAARFFSMAEQQQFSRLPDEDRLRGFFRCWTRKEAFIKATGEGLSRPLGSFDVTLGADEPPRLIRIAGGHATPEEWTLHSFEPAAGYLAAVAVKGPCPTLRRLDLGR